MFGGGKGKVHLRVMFRLRILLKIEKAPVDQILEAKVVLRPKKIPSNRIVLQHST